MHLRPLLVCIAFTASLPLAAAAAAAPAANNNKQSRAYPPKMEGARVETYREVDGVKLDLWIFEPASPHAKRADAINPDGAPASADAAAAKRPAIVLFFGGGWTSGSPMQFERQCRHFASRGMVAIAADYRVTSRHASRPIDSVADAKACLRWVRRNAARLGIDPDRIVAGGGSAGGHLAAATATLPGFDAPGDDRSIGAAPNALVLFNPALVLASYEGVDLSKFGERVSAERFGCEPREISPVHHVKRGAPPTLILHGRADTTVPYATAEAFAAAMTRAGNRCELVGYDDQPHGFFNGPRFHETLAEADRFLASLGYFPAPNASAAKNERATR